MTKFNNSKFNSFLPEGFETVAKGKNYINLGNKYPEGTQKYRIVGRPIAGWRYWNEAGKPIRSRPNNKPNIPDDPKNQLKAFWAVYVWDYQQEGLYIMEITQQTIMKSLQDLAMNEDWGDLTTFDFQLKKSGTGKDTDYSVMPIPHKPMDQRIIDAIKIYPVRLEALYEGKDPWTDFLPTETIASDFMALTEAQSGYIDGLLQKIGDRKFQDELEKHLKVTSIHNIEARDYDRAIRALEERIKSKEKSHGQRPMASVA